MLCIANTTFVCSMISIEFVDVVNCLLSHTLDHSFVLHLPGFCCCCCLFVEQSNKLDIYIFLR